MINYGIVYGLSDFGLADRLNIPREEAKEFIDAHPRPLHARRRVHGRDDRAGQGAELRDDAVGAAPADPLQSQARNYQVRMLGERLAVNTVIQGTAGYIIKLAMVRTHAALAQSGGRRRACC